MRIRPLLTRGLFLSFLGLWLLILVCPQGALAASDSYYTKESFRLAPDGFVVVEAAFQDVEVYQTAGQMVEVEVRMTFQAPFRRTVEKLIEAYEPVFTVDENRLQIRSVPDSKVSSSFTQASGKIKITVPAGTSLTVNTASGDCIFRGRFGLSIAVNTASGDVSFQGEVESFAANTASGKIGATFERPVIRVDANSASGDIWIDGPVASAGLHTVSGKVDLRGLDGGWFNISTVSGDLTATWATISAPVSLTVDSVSGDLRLFFPAVTKMKGQLKSRSGKISSDFPGEKAGQAKTLFLQDEGAVVQIQAATVSGSIGLYAGNRSPAQPNTAKETQTWTGHSRALAEEDPPPAFFLNLYRYEKNWAPGLKVRLYDRLYLTGNLDYSYRERDLNLPVGTVYFFNAPSSRISFYGGGGAQFSSKDGFQYPYLLVGTDFFFLFYELVYPWTEEVSPRHRFGLSIEL